MRLYKRGSVYWYELEFRGKRIRRSTKSKNQRTAGIVASAYRTALERGEVGLVERKPAPTFGQAMESFLAWSTQERSSHPRTAERYRYSSLALLKFFKDAPLDRITADDVERFKTLRLGMKARQSKQTLRPATVNRELACLRATFNHAMKGCPALVNPIRKIGGVKLLAENNQQERVLTYAEQEKYLASASPTLADVVGLILETGARPEEIFTLKPENIDLDHGFIRILRGKTPSARRRIEMTQPARAILERRTASTGVGYLFPRDGKPELPLRSLQSAHRRALKDSGVAKWRIYDGRHTWATRAAEAGIDLVTLAAMMGHSRIQLVMRYAHPTQIHQTSAMEKLVRHNAEQRVKEEKRAEAVRSSGLRVMQKSA